MISREVLEAQLALYQEAQRKMVEGLEKGQADLAKAIGAAEACQNLLRLLDQKEEAQADAEKKPKRKKK